MYVEKMEIIKLYIMDILSVCEIDILWRLLCSIISHYFSANGRTMNIFSLKYDNNNVKWKSSKLIYFNALLSNTEVRNEINFNSKLRKWVVWFYACMLRSMFITWQCKSLTEKVLIIASLKFNETLNPDAIN